MNANNNLPPGCTTADIDHAAGAYPAECEQCGSIVEACELDERGLCRDCAYKEDKEYD